MSGEEKQSVKKTRKKRAITIEDGVEGTEISLFIESLTIPEIKLTFLHLGKKIYKDVVKIHIIDEGLKNFDVLNYCNLLYYHLIANRITKISEVYQSIQMLFGNTQVRNFEIRPLKLNPYFQVTVGFPNYTKFTEKIKKEYFVLPLLEKGINKNDIISNKIKQRNDN